MPDVANGSAVKMYYCLEDVNGDIPATTPNFEPIRFNTESLSRDVTQIPTNEINPARQRGLDRGGTYSAAGQIVCEASYGSHDTLLEAAFQGTWATNVLKVGSTRRQISLLKHLSDIDVWYRCANCEITGFSPGHALNSRVLWTFDFVGTDFLPYTLPGDEVIGTQTSTETMVTTAGSLIESASTIAYATNIDLSFVNGMNPLFSLFQRPAYSIQNGIFVASGAMNLYMPDTTLFDKFLNESPLDMQITVTENSQSYQIDLPNAIFTTGDNPTPGDGALIPSYNLSAGYDGTEQSTVVITRTP